MEPVHKFFAIILILLSLLVFIASTSELLGNNDDPIKIFPSVKKQMNFPLGDGLLHVQSYSFAAPNFDPFNPYAALTESGEMALLTRSGLYLFDGKVLRSIPGDPEVSSSSFNNLVVSEEGWLWLVNRNRELQYPISKSTIYDYKKNRFQSGDDFLKGTALEGKELVNILSLHREKIAINTMDGEIFIFEGGAFRDLALDNNPLLIGKGPDFEIITREKTADGTFINIIDLKNDSIRKLPQLNTDKEIGFSFIRDGFLYALFGFDGQDGLMIFNLNKKNQTWQKNDNPLGLHCFGMDYDSKYFGFLNSALTYEVQNYNLIPSDHAKFLHEILSPEVALRKLSTAFGEWMYNRNGFHFIWKSTNNMNGAAGHNFFSGKSVRKIKFHGDSLLSIATHSGFYEMDISSFPEKPLEFIRDPDLVDCQKYYCLNFSFLNDEKLLLAGERIILLDFKEKSCEELFGPDGNKLEIWGMEKLAFNQWILGSENGPLILSQTEEDQFELKWMNYPKDYENYKNISINRIKRKNNSDTLILCTNAGLILSKWKDADQYKIEVLEIIRPNEIVYDAKFSGQSLFLATHHSGLLWLNCDDDFNSVFEYNQTNYFQSNTAHNIQKDNQDRLWVGTNNGLYIIHPEKRQIHQINKTDGFINTEFNRLASAKSPSGLLAFGGIDGISVFDPNAFETINEEKSITLNKIILYDEDGMKTYIYPQNQDSTIEISVGKSIKKAGFVFEGGLLQKQAELLMRRVGSNDFWMPLEESNITIQELENPGEVYELKVILPSGNIIISRTSFTFNFTKSYKGLILGTLVIPILILFYLILRSWRLSDKSSLKAPAEELDNHLRASPEKDSNQGIEENLAPTDNKLDRLQREMDLKEQSNLLHHHKQNDPFIRKLNELITENMDSKNLSVNYIAQKIHQSPRQLHRKVVARTGLSPQKYLSYKKLVCARQLINSNPELNISEVAYQCGFSKPSYFSKLFKTLYGLSPSKYKEKVQQ